MIPGMSTASIADHDERSVLAGRIRMLSWLTIVWLGIDGVLGMASGVAAGSVALIGWGLSCAIEAAAAVALIWRFSASRLHSDEAERLAQKVVGATFILLVPYIAVQAVRQLASGEGADASWIGVGLAASDAVLMPVLGQAKRRVGTRLASSAAWGAGTQNVLCAYLSAAVLVGLTANAVFEAWWADPIAALLVALVCVQAGYTTWRGRGCPAL
jgi:divalent metal cation (Fe/Co/Zn/Cd) transporter